jgi:hypothetical protein
LCAGWFDEWPSYLQQRVQVDEQQSWQPLVHLLSAMRAVHGTWLLVVLKEKVPWLAAAVRSAVAGSSFTAAGHSSVPAAEASPHTATHGSTEQHQWQQQRQCQDGEQQRPTYMQQTASSYGWHCCCS